ncbi:hypothetical protein BDV23DRAFT_188266 [Aspergillus alliaceus]|uniref:Uncharacterized protein n=1 Tax=Petromyces alliaceus TaxID=209559 RepID=A0A5N7BU81_PETAA|nr:hypothetical protein BDV23DRAFT_188266 [Aspergillus alliaceus]
MIQIGSSSPLTESSQRTSSLGFMNPESRPALASLEDETVWLAFYNICHMPYYAPPQNPPILPATVEVRDTKARLSAATPVKQRKIVAIDDGGLCFREESNGISKITKYRIAILDAKRHFQCQVNE